MDIHEAILALLFEFKQHNSDRPYYLLLSPEAYRDLCKRMGMQWITHYGELIVESHWTFEGIQIAPATIKEYRVRFEKGGQYDP